jgi:ribosomal protein S18 acetylase RimI-like enzyme
MSRTAPIPVAGISCRPATSNELQAAAAILLGADDRPATRSQVVEFFHFASQRNINVREIWVVLIGDEIVWAALPVPSPGRTLLLITPSHCAPRIATAAQELINRINDHFGRTGVQLSQVLIDPNQAAGPAFFNGLGFTEMAELIYLNGHAPRWAKPPALDAGLSWELYSPLTHASFAIAILESYQNSLDCPALSGLREIGDVIAGHQATGEFDPSLWQMLCEHQRPIGVLLLSKIPHTDSLELVYLGLAPSARRRGLGDLLMKQAMHLILANGKRRLTLAVDSNNAPALRLYYSHGMQRLTTKVAMIRDLRPPVASDLPASR